MFYVDSFGRILNQNRIFSTQSNTVFCLTIKKFRLHKMFVKVSIKNVDSFPG